MAQKKKRNKKYHPKTGLGMQGLLRKLPLSDQVVSDSLSAIYDSLLRLKLGENKRGGDLMLVIVYLAIGWYLAERHNASREPFAEQIRSLTDEAKLPGPISQGAFDRLMDFLPELTDFLKVVTTEEVSEAQRAISTPGMVPIIDDVMAETNARLVKDPTPAAGIASVRDSQ